MENRKSLSLVICTYNRDKFINAALQSLNKQSLDKANYEVIIVNNNCTDNTATIVDAFIKNHPEIDMRQVFETNQGLSFARNRGIKEAKYDIITYMDDDGIAAPDFLEKILNYLQKNKKVIGIGGKVIPLYETKEPDWYNPFLRMMVTAFDFGEQVFKCKGKRYPAGCNMTYTKQLLIDSGGFNNALKWRTDDKYIYNVVSQINDNIYYVPSIKVQHFIDDYRTTDENFDKLSRLLGSEERLRIGASNFFPFIGKVAEYVFKYFASILIAFYFGIKGQWVKGKYVIRFRKLALEGLLKG